MVLDPSSRKGAIYSGQGLPSTTLIKVVPHRHAQRSLVEMMLISTRQQLTLVIILCTHKALSLNFSIYVGDQAGWHVLVVQRWRGNDRCLSGDQPRRVGEPQAQREAVSQIKVGPVVWL